MWNKPEVVKISKINENHSQLYERFMYIMERVGQYCQPISVFGCLHTSIPLYQEERTSISLLYKYGQQPQLSIQQPQLWCMKCDVANFTPFQMAYNIRPSAADMVQEMEDEWIGLLRGAQAETGSHRGKC